MMQPSAELLLMPTYHKLIYFNEVDKGSHFAAWEQCPICAFDNRFCRPHRSNESRFD
jgi:hypothetical protein